MISNETWEGNLRCHVCDIVSAFCIEHSKLISKNDPIKIMKLANGGRPLHLTRCNNFQLTRYPSCTHYWNQFGVAQKVYAIVRPYSYFFFSYISGYKEKIAKYHVTDWRTRKFIFLNLAQNSDLLWFLDIIEFHMIHNLQYTSICISLYLLSKSILDCSKTNTDVTFRWLQSLPHHGFKQTTYNKTVSTHLHWLML